MKEREPTVTNLLEETREAIAESGHTEADIVFIGSEKTGHRCTWDEFETLANREYDSGFGASEVAQDLIVVFSDGQKLWRGEYDGSEWWNFSKPFSMPESSLPIKLLIVDETSPSCGWVDLSELN
jgi:hypothetical protein